MPPSPQSRRSRDAAEELRRAGDSMDAQAVGTEMHSLIRNLYPICRSITVEGLRQSLGILQRIAPLEVR